jgi:hypothetical protein
MIDLKSLFERVYARRFDAADAKEFIKRSYYFAGTHPDVHIVLSVRRAPDYHFQDNPQYEGRGRHSLFPSMEDAASGIAAALNCKAGEAALRFVSVSGVNRVTLYSRSGARAAPNMSVRSAIAVMGARTGTMYSEEKTAAVVLVLSIQAGYIVLTTAYPINAFAEQRPEPPPDHDLLEYGLQRFIYLCD